MSHWVKNWGFVPSPCNVWVEIKWSSRWWFWVWHTNPFHISYFAILDWMKIKTYTGCTSFCRRYRNLQTGLHVWMKHSQWWDGCLWWELHWRVQVWILGLPWVWDEVCCILENLNYFEMLEVCMCEICKCEVHGGKLFLAMLCV